MAEFDPALRLGLGDSGEPLVLLGKGREAADLVQLFSLAPRLQATDLARAANHLAHGTEYSVIDDPAAFADAYRSRIEREDPDAEWQEGVIRLRDFGMPDFGAIGVPAVEGDTLTYFAVDQFLGLPYKAVLCDPAQPPDYEPLPLTPCPRGTA